MPDYVTPSQVKELWEANAETWTRLARAGYDVYRDGLNTPAFLAMLPPVEGLNGLDIGCGEGSNTRLVAGKGARMTGLDVAPTFLRHARSTETESPLGIAFVEGDAMALPFPEKSFDFATAFMVMMDVPEPGRAFAEAFRVVRPGGFLQLSILHPCFVPPVRKVIRENGEVRGVFLSEYFTKIDGRVDEWIFSTVPAAERASVPPFRVPRYHRTMAEWIDLAVQAGWTVEKLGEPSATEEAVRQYPALSDTVKFPLFLQLRLRRPLAGS